MNILMSRADILKDINSRSVYSVDKLLRLYCEDDLSPDPDLDWLVNQLRKLALSGGYCPKCNGLCVSRFSWTGDPMLYCEACDEWIPK